MVALMAESRDNMKVDSSAQSLVDRWADLLAVSKVSQLLAKKGGMWDER